jgi:hypothetical protein
MGVIDQKSQTYMNNGVLTDAKTGQSIGTATNPTQDQLDARQGAAMSAAVNAPPAPISRTIDQGQPTALGSDPAETFLNTFKPPETREQITERKRQEAQGLIDSLNKTYDDQVAEKRKVGDERLSIDNAASVLSGLMGSTEAGTNRKATLDANDKEIQAVNNKRALDLSTVYHSISSEAETEAREQLADATRSAEAVIARRTASQTKAIDSLKQMASGGLVDFDAFKNSPKNKGVYDYALQSVGGSEDALRAMFMLNRPKDQIVGAPTRIGNKYVQAYQNPITGKVAYEQIDLPVDLPTEYTKFQQLGDNLVAIPDNWDGDTTKLKTVGSTRGTHDILADQLLQAQIAGQYKSNAKTQQEIDAKNAPGGAVDLSSLPAAIKDDLITMRTVRDMANQLLKAKTDSGFAGTGALGKGTVGNLLAKVNMSPASSIQNRNLVGNIKATIAKMRGGTSFTPNEEKLLNQYTPNINDSDSVLEQKLNDLIGYINTKEQNTLSVAGGKTAAAPASDIKSQVAAKGYDYDSMKADGHSDAEIRAAVGL